MERWSATVPKPPTEGRCLKLKGRTQVRSGVPTVPAGYGARVPGWEGDKGGEIPRSRDHGATVPSTPVRFLLLPQHPYPGGLWKQ